jgi:hypothetical protein
MFADLVVLNYPPQIPLKAYAPRTELLHRYLKCFRDLKNSQHFQIEGIRNIFRPHIRRVLAARSLLPDFGSALQYFLLRL